MTDTAGFLHAYVEVDGPPATAVPAWSATNLGGTVTTMPVVAPFLGKAYVGKSDGTLHQVNLATGLSESYGTVGAGTVFDPSPDLEGASPDINRLQAATPGQVRRFCAPFQPGTAGTM